MNGIMTIALSGIHTATDRFAASANRVVGDPRADLPAEIVEEKLAATQFKANVAVIRTADRMMKSLLDILA
jgi:flagellar basal body rod protein FlgC